MVDIRSAFFRFVEGGLAAHLAAVALLASGGGGALAQSSAVLATPVGLGVDLCALGVWRGQVFEPGFGAYAIRLQIAMRDGQVTALAEYPELRCASRGVLLEIPRGRQMAFREVVTRNRSTCADGTFVVTCLGGERLDWLWRWDDGETLRAELARWRPGAAAPQR